MSLNLHQFLKEQKANVTAMNKKQFIEGCQKRNLSITKAEEVYKRFKAIEPYFCMGEVTWGFLAGLTDPDFDPDDFQDLNDEDQWDIWGEFRLGEVCYKKERYYLFVLHCPSLAFLRIWMGFFHNFPDLLSDRNPETDKNPETCFYGAPVSRILTDPLENIGDKFLTPYKPNDAKGIAHIKNNFCCYCVRNQKYEHEHCCSILSKAEKFGNPGREWVYDVFNYPVCLGYQN